jgi:hypothetical protein
MAGQTGSRPAARSAGGQSPPRSVGTTIRSQPATAPCSVSTCCLAASTSPVSSSKQRTPGGQGSRNALVSNPAPSSTTWRTPSAHAAVISSSRNTVRATIHNRSAAACRLVARGGGLPAAATNASASGSANSRSGRAVSSARIPATVSPVPPTPSSILRVSQAAGTALMPKTRSRLIT